MATCFLMLSLSLGEIGGPINWAIPILVLAIAAFAFTAFIVRPRNVISGILCGVGFAVPIAIACYLPIQHEPVVKREHGEQLIFAALTIIVIAILVMGVRGYLRNTAHRNDNEILKH